MADVTITAANVAPTSTTVIERGTAGATITAGAPLYKDATANYVLKLADANVTTAEAAVVGIALGNASSGQPLAYATAGDVTYNAAFALGTVYVASATAGNIAPSADLDTSTGTNYGTVIGVASSTTNLKLCIMASGALNP